MQDKQIKETTKQKIDRQLCKTNRQKKQKSRKQTDSYVRQTDERNNIVENTRTAMEDKQTKETTLQKIDNIFEINRQLCKTNRQKEQHSKKYTDTKTLT